MLLGAKSKYAANNTLCFYFFFTLLRITQIYQVNFAATALCIDANAPRIAEMKIGNILRHRRKLLGKTLEDVAYAAETDAGNLSRIERDEQRRRWIYWKLSPTPWIRRCRPCTKVPKHKTILRLWSKATTTVRRLLQ